MFRPLEAIFRLHE